jgi:uncharacterized protein (DUF58 family)
MMGLFTGRAFFFNLAATFSGLLFVAFCWAWLSVRGIRIERKTRSRRSQVGRNFQESFGIYNWLWIPKLWIEVRDHSTLPGHQVSHVVPALSANTIYRWNVETPCLIRGKYQLGPMTVVGGDPFGLFTMPRSIDASSQILVYPATFPISFVDLPIGQLSGGEARRQRSFYITTNVAGIRDYVQGDSFNRIHWPSTARKDRLLVKEFELDPLVDIWLFPDFSATSLVEAPIFRRERTGETILPTGQDIPPSTEEYIVTITASLSKYFIDSERSLGYAAYAPNREVMQPERGSRQLSRVLQSLTLAHNTSSYSLSQMLALEAIYLTRGTTLVIVTSSVDPTWVSEAQLLSRRGIRLMCFVVDPSSFGIATSSDDVVGLLRVARIPTIIVRNNDNLSSVLAQQVK